MDDLFYPGPFEFRMGLKRGEASAFFCTSPGDEALLAKRRRILAKHPARHSALLPEGEPLLAEFARLLAGWGVVAKPPTLGQALRLIICCLRRTPTACRCCLAAVFAFRRRGRSRKRSAGRWTGFTPLSRRLTKN